MNRDKFSVKKRLKSFVYAFNGLLLLLKYEHNARIHLVAACCAVIAGLLFNISSIDWIAIVFAIGFVIAAETVNSSIEQLANFVSPEWHDRIKTVKDLAAAAVLVAAITAVIIGLIIFIPKIAG